MTTPLKDDVLDKAVLYYKEMLKIHPYRRLLIIPCNKAGKLHFDIGGIDVTEEVLAWTPGTEVKEKLPEGACLDCEKIDCDADYLSWVIDCNGSEWKSDGWDNNKIRHDLYKTCADRLHGKPGKGKQKPLPQCVVRCIRERFPDPSHDNTR